MKKLLIILWSVLSLTGCNNHFKAQFELVENLIQDAPDSALLILNSVQLDQISNRVDRAKYALLLTKALDKNYVDIQNDSLIRIAVDYYQDHGQPQEKLEAYYYLGRIQSNAMDYSHAIISYYKAENEIGQSMDKRYPGLIYRGIAEVHNATYNRAEELRYIQRAYESFKEAQMESHANYALMGIGIAYNNTHDFKNSAAVYDQVVELARNNADTSLLITCLENYSSFFLETDQPRKAIQTLNSIKDKYGTPLSSSDYGSLAYAYAKIGHPDSAAYMIKIAKELASDDSSAISVAFREYQVAELMGDYKTALERHVFVVNAQDSIVQEVLDQSIIKAQREFFKNESALELAQLKTHKQIGIIVGLCVTLIVLCGIYYFRLRLKNKNLEIGKYMDTIFQIQHSLEGRNKEISEINQLTQQLFREKFKFIDQLSNTYYERKNTAAEQDAIYKEVKRSINNLSSDKQTKEELEQIVNSCMNNIMLKIRAQLPSFKESDYLLLCYLYAGFSYRAISIFTQDKIENIYNKKSRLRVRISNSEAADKGLFLESLN